MSIKQKNIKRCTDLASKITKLMGQAQHHGRHNKIDIFLIRRQGDSEYNLSEVQKRIFQGSDRMQHEVLSSRRFDSWLAS